MGKRHSLKQIRAQRRAAPGCLGFTGCFGGSSHGFWENLNNFLFAAVNSNEEKSTWNCSASALRSIINDQVEAMREAGISAIASPCFGTMRLCGHSVFLKTESYNHRVRFLKSWLYSLSKKGVSVAFTGTG